jgi:hypothetical protein
VRPRCSKPTHVLTNWCPGQSVTGFCHERKSPVLWHGHPFHYTILLPLFLAHIPLRANLITLSAASCQRRLTMSWSLAHFVCLIWLVSRQNAMLLSWHGRLGVGHPRTIQVWPAMLTYDPVRGQFCRPNGKNPTKSYHVQFFGSAVTRARKINLSISAEYLVPACMSA